jgi:6-pyruvoyltetrahydropterin/6-carboxytetrahydropterin synthase
VIELTRRYRFPAAHVLASPRLSDAENRRIYGKCAHPAGHGHDYGVEVTVRGEIDPETGSLLPHAALDALVEARVVGRFGHRLLNADPWFADRVPTAENIARAIYLELEAPVAAAGSARLARVRVTETRKNSFVYGELS